MDNIKAQEQAAQNTPWMQIQEQIGFLDRSLKTINGDFKESELARMYLCAQIESLKWASRLWDVG